MREPVKLDQHQQLLIQSKARKRVLHVLGSLNRGGTETWLVTLFREMAQDLDVENQVLIQEPPGKGGYSIELDHLGVQVILIQRNIFWPIRLFKLLRAEPRYDVIHSHRDAFSAIVLLVAWLARVPQRIAQNHSSARSRQTIVQRLARRLCGWILGRVATQRVAVSELSRWSLFGGSDDKSEVIYCGINLEQFRFQDRYRRIIREELGIPESSPVVIHVGRLDPVKNHQFLLNVFANLYRNGLNQSHLVLVGTGELRGQLEQHAKELGIESRVYFAGSRSDVQSLLAAADVFVFPSHFEGLGLAAVEAQASGLPLVLADTIPDDVVVLPEYITRLRLDDSLDSWAKAIESAIAARLARRVDFDRFSRFDIRKNAAEMRKLYNLYE